LNASRRRNNAHDIVQLVSVGSTALAESPIAGALTARRACGTSQEWFKARVPESVLSSGIRRHVVVEAGGRRAPALDRGVG